MSDEPDESSSPVEADPEKQEDAEASDGDDKSVAPDDGKAVAKVDGDKGDLEAQNGDDEDVFVTYFYCQLAHFSLRTRT